MMDGGGRGAAARTDEERWGEAGGGLGGLGGCDGVLLRVAVVGVVVVEGGVAGAAVQVGDPAAGPALVWAAGHQAGLGRSLGADGHPSYGGILEAAEAAGEEASLLH